MASLNNTTVPATATDRPVDGDEDHFTTPAQQGGFDSGLDWGNPDYSPFSLAPDHGLFEPHGTGTWRAV